MIRRPPRSTQSRSSAASDVYKRQVLHHSLYSGFFKAHGKKLTFKKQTLRWCFTLPVGSGKWDAVGETMNCPNGWRMGCCELRGVCFCFVAFDFCKATRCGLPKVLRACLALFRALAEDRRRSCVGLRGCDFLLPTVRSTGFSRNRLRVTDRIPSEGGTANKKTHSLSGLLI